MKHNKKQSINKRKQQVVYLLEKVDLVFTAAYALLTQEIWVNLLNDKISIPEIANLAAYSLALAVVWAIIGVIKNRK